MRVDAPVAVKAPVFDGDESGGREPVELLHINRRFLDRTAFGDRTAAVVEQQQGRIGQRFQGARQWRGDDEPDQRDEDQRGDRIEIDRPTAALARRLRFRGVCRRFSSYARAARQRLRLERVGQFLDRHAAAAPDSIPCGHQYRTLAPVPGLAPVLYMSKTAKAIYADVC